MNENDNVKIDYQALYKQVAEKAAIDFLAMLIPDEASRKLIIGTMAIHRKYGIDPATSMNIMQEMARLVEEGKNDEES